jgi:Mrp family chromosome partitioning ATPase
MRGGRGKLPVLAEISGPAAGEDPVWSLRREDFDRLAPVRARVEGQAVVLVTGSGDLGRVLAVALAAAAGAAGRRTALLECDLARPRLAADLGLSPTPGLHEYLRWEATPAEILQPLALAGPAAVPRAEPLICAVAGRQAADAKTLLGLRSFAHMAAKLRGAYDLVVLAGPAIEADPDSLASVASHADGVLAAIAPEQAAGRELRAAGGIIARLPAAALGAVIVTG